MKTLTLLITLFSFSAIAQDSLGVLEGNNMSALLSNRGVFFNNNDLNGPGLEFPKEEDNYLIYANAFWFGGIDMSGSLKMATETYGFFDEDGESLRDLYPGAIRADGSAEAPEIPVADDVYIVSKEQILFHATNYNAWDYEAPDVITNWPAHGDEALGFAYERAPFADLNGNGAYEPALGEYPEIRGDHAAYIIMNDTGGPHTHSGGDALGIEIHFMFYQYEEAGFLSNTTFVNVRVINRTTSTFGEFIVGNFMDTDIGFADDDLAACDPENDMIYGFNGDLTDEGSGGSPGYGDNPPALGLVALNHSPAVCCALVPGGPFDLSGPSDYWNLMSGELDCGDEVEIPADRRLFMASESTVFGPGAVLCYDYAIIAHDASGDAFANVDGLKGDAADAMAHYEAQSDVYCDYFLGINEEVLEKLSFDIYPNPSTGSFMVQLEGTYDLAIYTMDGRSVFSTNNEFGLTEINTELASGSYLVVIENELGRHTEKLIVR